MLTHVAAQPTNGIAGSGCSRVFWIVVVLLAIPSVIHAQQDPVATSPILENVQSSPLSPPSQEILVDVPGAPAVIYPQGEVLTSPDVSGCDCGFDWSKGPPVEKFPSPGYFFLFPKGKGYFSLLDVVTDNYRESPPKFGYPRFGLLQFSFFNADWRYLEKPDNQHTDFFDFMKRVPLTDDFRFTSGGDFRIRYNNEVNSRLSGRNNTYSLLRTRVYGDLWYQDRARVFVEYIDAHSWDEDLPQLPIDENRSDLLNAFVDLKAGTIQKAPVYVRVGRQELLYGSQRLISPLEWGNTRRTFQGIKAFRHGEKLDVDFFAVQPVFPNRSRFDSVDNDAFFSGLWLTYRPREKQNIDFYVLNLDQTRTGPAPQGIPFGPFNVTTIGGRYSGQADQVLFDFEGALQGGEKGGQLILADAFTASVGYNFKDVPLTPQVWLGFDHASGDANPGVGQTNETFNQLFPFGHYYFGFIDVVGRQNINDFTGQLALFPSKWITTLVQFHVFRLDTASDALYNAGGIPIRRSAGGLAGRSVGEEVDLLMNIHLSKHQDILFSYSHLFAGSFLQRTGGGGDADYFYLQYVYRW